MSADGGLGRLLRYFLGLGTWGFGGPIATVGYMQRDLVERRAWIGRDDFVDGVALGQTMPGPLAAQVSMWRTPFGSPGRLGQSSSVRASGVPRRLVALTCRRPRSSRTYSLEIASPSAGSRFDS